jgi:hypothetical protein
LSEISAALGTRYSLLELPGRHLDLRRHPGADLGLPLLDGLDGGARHQERVVIAERLRDVLGLPRYFGNGDGTRRRWFRGRRRSLGLAGRRLRAAHRWRHEEGDEQDDVPDQLDHLWSAVWCISAAR